MRDRSAQRTIERHAGMIDPGTRVEVRNSLGRWSRGFEVEASGEDGYKLRRMSDGAILPVMLGSDAVRKDRRDDFWWH